MKKIAHILFIILSATLLVIFAVITLFCGSNFGWLSFGSFWTVWLMTVLPVLASTSICLVLLKKNNDELFPVIPILAVSGSFEVVSLAVGIKLITLISIFHARVTWHMWAIELIVLILYAALMTYLVFGTSYITKNRRQIKAKVFYIRSLVARLNVAMESTADKQLKDELKVLRDDIQYSDPMSNQTVAELEQAICETVDDIIARAETGALYEDCKLQIQKCRSLVRQRNETVRISK